MTVRLIALDKLPYGKDVHNEGAEFDASDEDSEILLGAGLAKASSDAGEGRRKYRRRDMRAED